MYLNNLLPTTYEREFTIQVLTGTFIRYLAKYIYEKSVGEGE